MRKVISKLLLLALVAGICNAQAQPPARPAPPSRPQQSPSAGASTARPSRPNNVAPGAPTRQQAPITRPANSATRSPPTNNNAVNRPAPPNRPSVPQGPQQPQQAPVRPPTNPGANAPNRPNAPSNPGANAPRPPAPQQPQAPDSPAVDAPAGNPSRPGQGGNQAVTTTTTLAPTTRRPPNSEIEGEHDLDNFPTAPTIAPTPDVVFITTPRGGVPPPPAPPGNPWVGEGRPDARCPMNQDARNPVHLSHDTDCGRFFKCDHGMAFEYRCPQGQHWNARRNYCDFPENANCRPNAAPRPQPLPMPQPQPFPPHNNLQPQFPEWNSNWNSNSNNNIAPWTSPPLNQNPGFENPIIIPMAPRS